MWVPTSIFTTIAQHSEKGQNTKNPTTWVIGQPTEWIGSGLAIMSQNVPAAAETSYLVLFLPGCASFVSYCIVLCCASFDFYGYIKDTHGSREEGRQKMAPSDQRSNIYVASNPKNSNLKVFLTNQNLARILIQTIWEEKIICTVKCQLFLYKQVTAKRHDLKYGISAKYYNWDFSSAGQF